MTADLSRPAAAPSFHEPAVFWPVVAATMVGAVISLTITLPSWATAAALVGVIAVLGIPHGSLDHVVTARFQGGRFSLRRFVAGYLAAMAAIAALWLVSPTAALIVFLVVSIHHFGQSDLAHITVGGLRQLQLQWTRGLVVIALPLLAHLDEIAPTIDLLGAGGLADWATDTAVGWPWLAGIVGLHAAALGNVAPAVTTWQLQREIVTVLALTPLLLVAGPLVGFAVYFGLWHSLNHLLVLADTIDPEGQRPSRLINEAIPLTAVSLAGLFAIALAAFATGRAELIVPLAFVFVSMLTVPHLVVVERLSRWRRLRTSPTSAPTPRGRTLTAQLE